MKSPTFKLPSSIFSILPPAAKRIITIYSMLKNGAKIKTIAEILKISERQTFRLISALASVGIKVNKKRGTTNYTYKI